MPDSSPDPFVSFRDSWFVICGSCDRCDFVVCFPLIHRQKQTTKKHKHKTNPHEGRKSDESSILLAFQRLANWKLLTQLTQL